MGSSRPCCIWALVFFCADHVLLLTSMAEEAPTPTLNASRGEDPSLLPSVSSPPGSSIPPRSNVAPLRPSIAVIVGVLTTMFSVTFLLLLYAKHCRTGGANGGTNPSSGFPPASAHRNSGIERGVIESLPIFRFGSLQGEKEGLECAVCLSRFELSELLRLLPKCKHAFHVECVDTWLDAHSTCPLCRCRVDPEDVLLVEEPPGTAGGINPDEKIRFEGGTDLRGEYRRLSGRHSSAGEKSSGFLQAVLVSGRRSVDFGRLKKPAPLLLEVETVGVGCFDRVNRRDTQLPTDRERFEHRIIVSDSPSPVPLRHRWSEQRPSDLLYLPCELIITDSRRHSLSHRRKSYSAAPVQPDLRLDIVGSDIQTENSRCVSEITGLSRLRRAEEAKTVNSQLFGGSAAAAAETQTEEPDKQPEDR